VKKRVRPAGRSGAMRVRFAGSSRCGRRGAAARLHRDRFDDDRLAAVDEAEARAVRRLESAAHVIDRHGPSGPFEAFAAPGGESRDGERRVGAGVADMGLDG
jgi:hypothetical protein